MTCEEFERVLLDSSSSATAGGWMLRASREALVQAHVQDCPPCATKMMEDARLKDALDQLRLSTRHMQAPVAVEKNLLDAFHRQAARAHSSGRTALPWRLVWLSAAAVVLVAAGLLLLSRLQPSSLITTENHRSEAKIGVPHTTAVSGRPEKDAKKNPGLAAESPVSQSRSRVAKARKPIPGTVGVRAPAELHDELSLNGGGSIVRVTLPLSSLTAMGLPLHADLSDPRVTADVWMDPFGGVMRVRLVADNRSAN
jgi:hypothetical protein